MDETRSDQLLSRTDIATTALPVPPRNRFSHLNASEYPNRGHMSQGAVQYHTPLDGHANSKRPVANITRHVACTHAHSVLRVLVHDIALKVCRESSLKSIASCVGVAWQVVLVVGFERRT